jgi:hypothetical protein
MKRIWKDQDITKAIKQMAKATPDEMALERAWIKLEDRINSRQKHFWQLFVWKPLSHPVRWVAAACLCLGFTGLLYNQVSITDNEDMASFMVNVSRPASNVSRDLGVVKVPTLLSAPSGAAAGILKVSEDRPDILSGDDILL